MNTRLIAKSIQVHTNKERRRRGLKPLKGHKALIKAAKGHSSYMARTRRYSHTGAKGSKPWDRAAKAGFPTKAVGENIWTTQGRSGRGQAWKSRFRWRNDWQLGKAAVVSWMNSPGHKSNILSKDWNYSGMGVATTRNGRVYLTQAFGKVEIYEHNIATKLLFGFGAWVIWAVVGSLVVGGASSSVFAAVVEASALKPKVGNTPKSNGTGENAGSGRNRGGKLRRREDVVEHRWRVCVAGWGTDGAGE